MVFSPSADVLVVRPLGKTSTCFVIPYGCITVLSHRPHDKDICRGGEYYRLLVQFRPPDDGPVRPETCRGKKTTVIGRKKKQCIKLEIKNKFKKRCTIQINILFQVGSTCFGRKHRPKRVDLTWNNKLIYIVHLVGYYRSSLKYYKYVYTYNYNKILIPSNIVITILSSLYS